MTLRTKLPLFSSLIVFVSIVIVTAFSMYVFKRYVEKSIKDYRKEQTTMILHHLQDIVNIAYRMIDQSYRVSQEEMKKYYGFEQFDTIPENIAKMIRVNLLKITVSQLRTLRFGKDGYLWINEFDPPYTVIMHGTKPELEGKSWVFFIEGTDINVYQAFHDSIVAGGGAGRVTYNFYKPGTNERVPKISWVRLYKPLRWVIGTGVYVDEIDKMVAQKREELRQQLRMLGLSISLLTAILVVVSILLLYLFARSITEPLFKIKQQLAEMAKGKLVEATHMNRKDEIGQMNESLLALIDGLKRYARFAEEIGRGNFDAEFEPLSPQDVLGNELLLMRDRLVEARKRELEQLEQEKIRHWISTGVSMFSDLITAHFADIQKLCDVVLERLTEYVGAVVGGIFLVKFYEDDPDRRPYLEQVSTIAYNRRKIIQKRLEINEGLVGACFTEREPIYITDVPDNYIEIRTGLGGALPKNIYLTPIKYEFKVFGVIELASFETFEEHHRQLIDQVAQSLAVSLSTHQYYIGRELDVDKWFKKGE